MYPMYPMSSVDTSTITPAAPRSVGAQVPAITVEQHRGLDVFGQILQEQ